MNIPKVREAGEVAVLLNLIEVLHNKGKHI